MSPLGYLCRGIKTPMAVFCWCFASSTLVDAGSFPSYGNLTGGVWDPRLLPGQSGVVFTMYGAPRDVEGLRRMVEMMKREKLGNGFDPGPAAHADNKAAFDYLAGVGWPVMAYPGCADMQIKGGDCILNAQDRTALSPLDQAGVFSAVQLGEWGYYFHNLSCNEPWWRDVYGREFDSHKHLMKPAGLAGYDRRPLNRRECYEILRDYFMSRSRDLLDRTISVTGHSHYEAYAAEWGARCIGLEVGENIAFTQSKLAFARGASRQWHRPWSVQVSPWFAGACTTSGPLRQESGGARGLDAGHSLSFYERMWLHAWFAGAAMVTPENSGAIFFEPGSTSGLLTAHGRKAAEVFGFMREHERGVPWTPVAIILDHLAGYNGYMDTPWGILEPSPGDREIRDLFDHQLFPGSDHIHGPVSRDNPEASYLRETPCGESFDVLLTTVTADVLSSYPVILLAGDIEFDEAFLHAITQSLRHKSRVLISDRQRLALGARFANLKRQGRIEVLEPWINPKTSRNTAISEKQLGEITRKYLPVQISGDPIQYQINRTPKGWVIELVNNRGVRKKPGQPAETDADAIARVCLKPAFRADSAIEWRTLKIHDKPKSMELMIGPGRTEFVEFVQR